MKKLTILLVALIAATTNAQITREIHGKLQVKEIPEATPTDSLLTVDDNGEFHYLPKSFFLLPGDLLPYATETWVQNQISDSLSALPDYTQGIDDVLGVSNSSDKIVTLGGFRNTSDDGTDIFIQQGQIGWNSFNLDGGVPDPSNPNWSGEIVFDKGEIEFNTETRTSPNTSYPVLRLHEGDRIGNISNFIGATFYGRVKGEEAINPNEYTTLGQVNNLISSNSTSSVFEKAANGGVFISGRNEDNYGDLGENAFDTSFSEFNGDYGATGNKSVAFGDKTTASGVNSTAFGFLTTASNRYSIAFGSESTASGYLSTAFGSRATASGRLSIAFGSNVEAYEEYSIALGINNNMTLTPNALFQIGNGDAPSNKNNAYTLNKDATSYQDNIAFYNADYSANYTDRSLVDKAYVDNAVANAGGGGATYNLVAENGNTLTLGESTGTRININTDTNETNHHGTAIFNGTVNLGGTTAITGTTVLQGETTVQGTVDFQNAVTVQDAVNPKEPVNLSQLEPYIKGINVGTETGYNGTNGWQTVDADMKNLAFNDNDFEVIYNADNDLVVVNSLLDTQAVKDSIFTGTENDLQLATGGHKPISDFVLQEVDPVFDASAAKAISLADIQNWNASSAVFNGDGDHVLLDNGTSKPLTDFNAPTIIKETLTYTVGDLETGATFIQPASIEGVNDGDLVQYAIVYPPETKNEAIRAIRSKVYVHNDRVQVYLENTSGQLQQIGGDITVNLKIEKY